MYVAITGTEKPLQASIYKLKYKVKVVTMLLEEDPTIVDERSLSIIFKND